MNTTDNLYKLSSEQIKAFKKLKKCFDDCKKLNLGFYNNYGTIGAFDKRIISVYDDNASGILDQGQNWENEFKLPCNEWADDSHFFHIKKQ